MMIHGKVDPTGEEGSVHRIRKGSGSRKPCDQRRSGEGDLVSSVYDNFFLTEKYTSSEDVSIKFVRMANLSYEGHKSVESL